MARTTFVQNVQSQNSTKKNTLPCQEPLYFFRIYCSHLDWIWMSLFIGSMDIMKLLPKFIWLIKSMSYTINGEIRSFWLMKMFNLTLKRREALLFLLIVVINGLKCIVSDIGLDTCAKGRWRVEVSKLKMNQPLGSSYLTTHSEKLPYQLVSKWHELILHFYYGQ